MINLMKNVNAILEERLATQIIKLFIINQRIHYL